MPAADLPARSAGRWRVVWTPAGGLRAFVDGVLLIHKSSLAVVSPSWDRVHLDQTGADWRTDGWQGDRATLTAENDTVAATLTFALTPDALTIALRYRLKREVPAAVEWATAWLSAPVLAGAALDGDATLPKVPETPTPGASQMQSRLGPPLTRLTFDTPLGRLTLRYDGTAPRPVCFDTRADAQPWFREYPIFWIGIGSPAAPVAYADGERVAALTLSLGPAPALPPTPPRSLPTAGVHVRDAYLPPELPLVPTPKRRTDGGAPLRLTPRTAIVAGHDPQPARLLADAIQTRFGWRPAIVARGAGIDLTGHGLTPQDRPEGYTLTVDAKGARLAGRDAAGTRWGVQTLIQLLRADLQGPLLPATRIDDWPTLALRGAHLFHGPRALPFHTKLLERILARTKLNTLLIQLEPFRWENVAVDAASATKADIRAEIARAAARGIATFPLIQGYGHLEWLLQTRRELAEDPEKPYALNVSDPKAVALLERVLVEADELFGASAFHVGLDEVPLFGRFPHRSAPKRFEQLIPAAARHWRDFLKARGKTMWMWADMALAPPDGQAPDADAARAVRDALPRDIVLFDWQYGIRESYPSYGLLRRAGFEKVVAATWYEPENIARVAKAAADAGAWGGLQTTWCGYDSHEGLLDGDARKQFTALLLAAEHYWNGGATRPTWSAAALFAALWADPTPARFQAWAGVLLGSGKAQRLVDGVLTAPLPEPIALRCRLSRTPLPESVTVALPPGDGEVEMLLSASHAAPSGETVGEVAVGAQRVALVYGRNIAVGLQPLRLPTGGATRLTITSAGVGSAPVLHAVTRLSPPGTAPGDRPAPGRG